MLRALTVGVCVLLGSIWTAAASGAPQATQSNFVAYSYQLVSVKGSATESWNWPNFATLEQLQGTARVDFSRRGPIRHTKSIGYITKTGGLAAVSLSPSFHENGSYLDCSVGTCTPKTCSGKQKRIDSVELDFHKSIHSNTVQVVFSMPVPAENANCPAVPGSVPQNRMTKSFPFSLFKGIGHDGLVTLPLEGDYTYVAAGLSGGHATFEWTYEVVLKRV